MSQQLATPEQLKSKLSGKQVILVQGACGTIGCEVVKSLMARIKDQPNMAVVAGACDANDPNAKCLIDCGANLVYLDLTKHDSVESVFSTLSVNKLLIMPPFMDNRVTLVHKLIDVAYSRGVRRMLLLSALVAPSENIPFFNDLKAIQNKITSYSDINCNIVKCTAYMEDLFRMKKMIKSGSLNLPLANNKWVPIAGKDVANLIAKLMVEGFTSDQEIGVTGPESLTGTQIADILSQNIGRKVTYMPTAPNDFKSSLTSEGVSGVKAKDLTDLFDWYGRGNGNRVTTDYEKVCGTKPRTLTEFVKENVTQFQ